VYLIQKKKIKQTGIFSSKSNTGLHNKEPNRKTRGDGGSGGGDVMSVDDEKQGQSRN
jgi:hypothetical protein